MEKKSLGGSTKSVGVHEMKKKRRRKMRMRFPLRPPREKEKGGEE